MEDFSTSMQHESNEPCSDAVTRIAFYSDVKNWPIGIRSGTTGTLFAEELLQRRDAPLRKAIYPVY
jgi:hypothetical protein